jgi:hypothetical protein
MQARRHRIPAEGAGAVPVTDTADAEHALAALADRAGVQP